MPWGRLRRRPLARYLFVLVGFVVITIWGNGSSNLGGSSFISVGHCSLLQCSYTRLFPWPLWRSPTGGANADGIPKLGTALSFYRQAGGCFLVFPFSRSGIPFVSGTPKPSLMSHSLGSLHSAKPTVHISYSTRSYRPHLLPTAACIWRKRQAPLTYMTLVKATSHDDIEQSSASNLDTDSIPGAATLSVASQQQTSFPKLCTFDTSEPDGFHIPAGILVDNKGSVSTAPTPSNAESQSLWEVHKNAPSQFLHDDRSSTSQDPTTGKMPSSTIEPSAKRTSAFGSSDGPISVYRPGNWDPHPRHPDELDPFVHVPFPPTQAFPPVPDPQLLQGGAASTNSLDNSWPKNASTVSITSPPSSPSNSSWKSSYPIDEIYREEVVSISETTPLTINDSRPMPVGLRFPPEDVFVLNFGGVINLNVREWASSALIAARTLLKNTCPMLKEERFQQTDAPYWLLERLRQHRRVLRSPADFVLVIPHWLERIGRVEEFWGVSIDEFIAAQRRRFQHRWQKLPPLEKLNRLTGGTFNPHKHLKDPHSSFRCGGPLFPWSMDVMTYWNAPYNSSSSKRHWERAKEQSMAYVKQHNRPRPQPIRQLTGINGEGCGQTGERQERCFRNDEVSKSTKGPKETQTTTLKEMLLKKYNVTTEQLFEAFQMARCSSMSADRSRWQLRAAFRTPCDNLVRATADAFAATRDVKDYQNPKRHMVETQAAVEKGMLRLEAHHGFNPTAVQAIRILIQGYRRPVHVVSATETSSSLLQLLCIFGLTLSPEDEAKYLHLHGCDALSGTKANGLSADTTGKRHGSGTGEMSVVDGELEVSTREDSFAGKHTGRWLAAVLDNIQKERTAAGQWWRPIHYVDDDIENLKEISKQRTLDDVQLYFAEWGFSSLKDKVDAHDHDRLRVLSGSKRLIPLLLTPGRMGGRQWTHGHRSLAGGFCPGNEGRDLRRVRAALAAVEAPLYGQEAEDLLTQAPPIQLTHSQGDEHPTADIAEEMNRERKPMLRDIVQNMRHGTG
eukprot:GHVT01032114.1.p1 GENE.GHVT01032114.1~~GHVT01032114.1.p1  ORF type:complete len:1013 (+),score=86.28 GHVT01032114.1:1692-4730(+)